MLRALPILAGADDTKSGAPQGTSNNATLFQETAAAARLFCVTPKPKGSSAPAASAAALAPANAATLSAVANGSAAAAAGDAQRVAAQYAALERATVARFLQLSLAPAREAQLPASAAAAEKAGPCRSSCLRESQTVGGRARGGAGSGHANLRCCVPMAAACLCMLNSTQ
jgi:hypothetical protein